jgi:hypothetical protein
MASFGVTTPSMGRITIMMIPTTSTLTHSKIKSSMANTRTAMTMIIWVVRTGASVDSPAKAGPENSSKKNVVSSKVTGNEFLILKSIPYLPGKNISI